MEPIENTAAYSGDSISSISWNGMNYGLPSVSLWPWDIWHVASFLSSPCCALQEIFASELLWNQRCLIWIVRMLCKIVRMLKMCKGTIFGGTVREHRCFQPPAATRSFFGIWNTAKRGRLESLGWFYLGMLFECCGDISWRIQWIQRIWGSSALLILHWITSKNMNDW